MPSDPNNDDALQAFVDRMFERVTKEDCSYSDYVQTMSEIRDQPKPGTNVIGVTSQQICKAPFIYHAFLASGYVFDDAKLAPIDSVQLPNSVLFWRIYYNQYILAVSEAEKYQMAYLLRKCVTRMIHRDDERSLRMLQCTMPQDWFDKLIGRCKYPLFTYACTHNCAKAVRFLLCHNLHSKSPSAMYRGILVACQRDSVDVVGLVTQHAMQVAGAQTRNYILHRANAILDVICLRNNVALLTRFLASIRMPITHPPLNRTLFRKACQASAISIVDHIRQPGHMELLLERNGALVTYLIVHKRWSMLQFLVDAMLLREDNNVPSEVFAHWSTLLTAVMHAEPQAWIIHTHMLQPVNLPPLPGGFDYVQATTATTTTTTCLPESPPPPPPPSMQLETELGGSIN